VPNPCLDLTCEFICLLNPSGASCACPEGKSLVNGTCIDQSLLGRYWKLCLYVHDFDTNKKLWSRCFRLTFHLGFKEWADSLNRSQAPCSLWQVGNLFGVKSPLIASKQETLCELSMNVFSCSKSSSKKGFLSLRIYTVRNKKNGSDSLPLLFWLKTRNIPNYMHSICLNVPLCLQMSSLSQHFWQSEGCQKCKTAIPASHDYKILIFLEITLGMTL